VPVRNSDLSDGAPSSNSGAVVSQEKPRPGEDSESIETYPASGIISYAQNREDILLWRVLHDVEDGFYIDVGAQDPSQDSVTRAFYDRGWRGINIEPAAGYFEKLCGERPRDLTLQIALGDLAGVGTLYEFPDTGWSTLVKRVASKHRANGFDFVDQYIEILTLATVWEKFVKGEVHFLKIDVEGFERQVVAGAELARFRPWIILIEATEPGTPKDAWEDWEPILLGSRYNFVHFDGLNRWYLAEERSSLRLRFEVPPNIFDRFQLAAIVSLQNRAAVAECKVKQMQASASWRITAPLRVANDCIHAVARWLGILASRKGTPRHAKE
jgi:FkbM family methyltransferase